jgi:hypothetical protein
MATPKLAAPKLSSDEFLGVGLPLVREAAKSGRSRCGVCSNPIACGEQRVGTQRRGFRGYLMQTWHHEKCYEQPWGGTIDPPEPTSKQLVPFYSAARLAVRDQVSAFRREELKDGSSVCPITGKTISDSTNGHVHHFGPTAFKAIADAFVKEQGLDLSLVSYTGGCFSSKSLHTTFQEYHDRQKRFLLVHKDANLSDLRRNPDQGPCDICHESHQLTWIFKEGVCGGCRAKPDYRRNYLSQQQVRQQYGLGGDDLAAVDYQPMRNPTNSNFAPMKLFRKLDIHAVAKNKHGSVEAARELQADKNASIKKRKFEAYANAATLPRSRGASAQVAGGGLDALAVSHIWAGGGGVATARHLLCAVHKGG